MAKRTGIVSLLCLAVAACGGNDGNAAASRQFTYGTPGAATSVQTAALQSSLSSMALLQSAPDASTAVSFTEFSGVTYDLFGDSGLSFAAVAATKTALAKAQNAALLSPTDYGTGFDDPACVTVTSTSVQLSGCTITLKDSLGTPIGTVKADGSVTLSNSNQTLAWDLKLSVHLTFAGSGGGSGDGSFHSAGNVTVQAPTDAAPGTVKGSMTSEVSVSASGGGQSESMRVDESLDINVTYENIPTTCVIGGTVEAKRVFADWSIPNMSRPADKGVKVTWTGCGTGEIAFSTN